MNKKFITLMVVVVIILAGLFLFQKNYLKKPLQKITVRLGWVHQAQFAGFYMAQEKGYYKKAGLEVELLELDENSSQTEELATGRVDFSIMEAHQLLAGLDDNEELKAVAAVYQINPHVLAVREDSGINGPEDFSNKLVGLSGGEGEGNALFQIFIEDFGNKNVKYKNLGFDTVNDFIEKSADIIDVYRIDQPYLAQQRGVPLRLIPLEAYGFSTYGDVIVTNSDFVDSNPELIKAFVSASMKGWDYALKNPEETVNVTLQFASGYYQDRGYQEHILLESLPLIRGESKILGRMELVPWSTLYESMKRAGFLKRNIDVKDIYTNDFIK